MSAVALLLAPAACGSGGERAGADAGSTTPVVVDTDLSSDDVLALLYLLRRPDVNLKAIVVSGTGVVHCPAGARNALELLALSHRDDVPVACGATRPLSGFDEFPPEWRATADGLYGLELPPARRAPDADARRLLRGTLDGSAGGVTVLSLAPLTDVAALLRADPEAAGRIAHIVAMGGAVDVPGNIGAGHERVEYNLWIDPVATREVASRGIPLTLVPLDATNDAPLTVWLAEVLRRYHYATPEATAAWDLLSANPYLYGGGGYLWDPLTAAAIVRPDVLRFADARLDIVTAAGTDHGRTVAAADGAGVRVATGADRAAFEHQLLATLLGGAAFAGPAPSPGAVLAFGGGGCSYRGPHAGPAGSAAFDTVNGGGRSFRFVLGRLAEGKTVADLRRAVARAHGRLVPSPWFTPEATGETPPHSSMTWVVALTPGRKALACIATRPEGAWVVTPVVVTAAR